MKLRHLESHLSALHPFPSPSLPLEQYPTPAPLAAHLLLTIAARTPSSSLAGAVVCDLGCGTGVFAIGAALLGARHVLAVDIDPAALAVAHANACEAGVADVVQCCRADVVGGEFVRGEKVFDVVVMNPPFGTKRAGVDVAFLLAGVRLAAHAVYSMHKTTTRAFIEKQAQRWGAQAEVLAETRFDIGRMHKFHREQNVQVDVDFWEVDVTGVPTGMDMATTTVDIGAPCEVIARRRGRPGRGKGKGKEKEKEEGKRGEQRVGSRGRRR